MDKLPNIYQSMAQIMKSVEAIKKEKTNSQGVGFKYRGIDDVMNSLHNAFAEAGVFITTDVLERSEMERQSRSGGVLIYVTQLIRFTFHAPDGSSISSTVNGTAMDSGDKADNKSLSIGLKYALLQAFLIPTEDMAEPDAQTHEIKPKAPLAKVPPSDAIWKKIISRLENKEDIIEAVRQTYSLTEEQRKTLDIYQKQKES